MYKGPTQLLIKHKVYILVTTAQNIIGLISEREKRAIFVIENSSRVILYLLLTKNSFPQCIL